MHEKLEQLELEKADAVRLAALRGRAADARSAALRAAEIALAKKRSALAEALKARDVVEAAALARSQAQLLDNDSEVRADSYLSISCGIQLYAPSPCVTGRLQMGVAELP